MVKDMGLGSNPDYNLPAELIVLLNLFCLSFMIHKMGIMINLPYNSVVRTQHIKSHKVLT